MESNKNKAILLFEMVAAKLDRFDYQHLRTLLRFLNLAPKIFALSCEETEIFQLCCKTPKKSS
jgi:hypothetical protein